MSQRLRVPCAYQGGKQRVSEQIADALLQAAPSPDTIFYDLCCGSGAVSIELVNRGIDPSRIVMLDLSSWGEFWSAIGSGTFQMHVFDEILADIPADKRLVKSHMKQLATLPANGREAEVYTVLQASSFGGKQIWHDNDRWENAFFRDYWEPTATSVRRSPANPMQPSPVELRRRVAILADGMKGVTCKRADIATTLDGPFPQDAVVYIDPPYGGTTGYAFGFDVKDFADRFRDTNSAPLFISEGKSVSTEAMRLNFGGAKGGISGSRVGRHQEWLSRF
ncbi:hypothetical protein CIK64_12300 [Brevibacterium aurantiacum]|uniref:Uncharacterized protein n=1 Tax=Brevibacterium aurantiacum TaxID=273384 RepID=A0A2A3Z3H0_BREAU|nr:hypothetical protein CIK64_12300 [Brevibacterium aurantiacum]